MTLFSFFFHKKKQKKPWSFLTFFVAFTMLPACGTLGVMGEKINDNVNPEMPSWYTRPSGSLTVTYRRDLTAASRKTGERFERGRPAIDVKSNRVFVGSSDRGLYALRATDGGTIWRYETLGAVQSEPIYDPELDCVYFGSNDGALYVVRAFDGSLIYRYDSGAEISRKVVVAGETLLFSNAADYLFAIQRRTGQTRWKAHRSSALGMEIAGYAGPAVEGNLVYMAYSEGVVTAYDLATGTEKWDPVDLSTSSDLQGDALKYLDSDSTPLLGDGPNGRVVFVSHFGSGVVALDAQTGGRVWINEAPQGVIELNLWDEPAHRPNPNSRDRFGALVSASQLLLVSSPTTGLWALDPLTGREIWRNHVPEGGMTAPVAYAGGLLVGTSRYGLFLLSPKNGKVIDGIDVVTGFSATPASWGSRAFVLSNEGIWYGIQVTTPLPAFRQSASSLNPYRNMLR